MKKIMLTGGTFILLCMHSPAQNLIPNAGFENFNFCPQGVSTIDYSTTYASFTWLADWIRPCYWTTPDYFNTCSLVPLINGIPLVGIPANFTGSNHPAHTGNGYVGLFGLFSDTATYGQNSGFNDYREYIQCRLLQPLKSGTSYCFSYYARFTTLANEPMQSTYHQVAINTVGVYFSDTLVYDSLKLKLNFAADIQDTTVYIQDTTSWVKITGNYTAQGGEEWFLLGNFDQKAKPAYLLVKQHVPITLQSADRFNSYILIDDLKLLEIPPDPHGTGSRDTFMCADSFVLTLSGKPDGIQYIWSTGDTQQHINITQDGTYWCKTVWECFDFTDTIHVISDSIVHADFIPDQHYGCGTDTLMLSNLSTGHTSSLWYFGDNSSSTAHHPVHYYGAQGSYMVLLIASNSVCRDSVLKQVDFNHPLAAAFAVSPDTICQHEAVSFTNNSVAVSKNNIDPSYHWDFGEGNTSSAQHPVHQYDSAGIFHVRLIVKDFVPCTDTAYHTVVVDPLPYAGILSADSILCEGTAVSLGAFYQQAGNRAITWDFGDGTIAAGKTPAVHAYDTSGTFTVRFHAAYRKCAGLADSMRITIRPYPRIDLGPDTSLCPNSAPLVLADRINEHNPAARWLWNTGDTASRIRVVHHGLYAARVMINGCSTTDSIEVFKDCYIDIPNVFTPNGDGINDYFFPREFLSEGLTAFRMILFDRWGIPVFETDRTDGRGWDGKYNNVDQPAGVYVYLITATFKNGTMEKYQGNVTLMR